MASESIYINISDLIPLSQKGVADGVASLDSNGHVPLLQLPFSTPLDYKGGWNASTNTPILSNASGTVGWMYITNVAGSQNLGGGSIDYSVGDVLVYNGSIWEVVGSVGGTFINGTGYIKASGTTIVYVPSIGDSDISSAATWNAKQAALSGTGIVKSTSGTISYVSGTSSQFVKADASLDSNTYGALNANNTWTAAQRGSFTTLTDAATIDVDLSLSNHFRVILGGNRVLGVPTNGVEGQSGVFNIWQDGSGSKQLAYSWCYEFPNATAPTLTTTKYAKDQLPYMINRYKSSSSITGTNANPGLFTWTNHGLISGDRIQFSAGTTTTPVLNTTYWIYVVDANTFRLASSLANLGTGSFVNTSGISGSLTGAVMSITISNLLNLS